MEVDLDADVANDQLPKEVLERSAQSAGGRTSRDAWNILKYTCRKRTSKPQAWWPRVLARRSSWAVAAKVKYGRILRTLMVAIWVLRSRCAELYYLVFRF